MASAQASESKKLDQPTESDDFDAATDLCDFGFVLAPPKPAPENRRDSYSSPQ